MYYYFSARAKFASIIFRVPSTSCCDRFCSCFSPRGCVILRKNKFLPLKELNWDVIILLLRWKFVDFYSIFIQIMKGFYSCLFFKNCQKRKKKLIFLSIPNIRTINDEKVDNQCDKNYHTHQGVACHYSILCVQYLKVARVVIK